MTNFSDEVLVEAHKHSRQNRQELEKSRAAGCFYCGEVFSPFESSMVIEWIDTGQTAKCPKCGIDSLLGSAGITPLSLDFLTAMRQHYFTPAGIAKKDKRTSA